MIHGSNASVGCLAMGDEVAEDLFVLAALAKPRNVSVVVAPVDLRRWPRPATAPQPAWTDALYREVGAVLDELPPG